MCDIDTINKQGYYLEQAPLQRSSTRYEVDDCLFADKTEFARRKGNKASQVPPL